VEPHIDRSDGNFITTNICPYVTNVNKASGKADLEDHRKLSVVWTRPADIKGCAHKRGGMRPLDVLENYGSERGARPAANSLTTLNRFGSFDVSKRNSRSRHARLAVAGRLV